MLGLAVLVDTRNPIAIGGTKHSLAPAGPSPSGRSSGWWWAARRHWRSPSGPLVSCIRRPSGAPSAGRDAL